MYRVITYKSKPLKKNTIIFEGDSSSSDFGEKKKKEEITYLIDDVEVREEDLTPDEKLDIEANAILNQDGFYTPLQPIDKFMQPEQTHKKSGNGWKIALIVAGTVAILAGIVAVMIFVL